MYYYSIKYINILLLAEKTKSSLLIVNKIVEIVD